MATNTQFGDSPSPSARESLKMSSGAATFSKVLLGSEVGTSISPQMEPACGEDDASEAPNDMAVCNVPQEILCRDHVSTGSSVVTSTIAVQPSVRTPPPVLPKPAKRRPGEKTEEAKTIKPPIPPKPARRGMSSTKSDDKTSLLFYDESILIPKPSLTLNCTETAGTSFDESYLHCSSNIDTDSNDELLTSDNPSTAERELCQFFATVHSDEHLGRESKLEDGVDNNQETEDNVCEKGTECGVENTSAIDSEDRTGLDFDVCETNAQPSTNSNDAHILAQSNSESNAETEVTDASNIATLHHSQVEERFVGPDKLDHYLQHGSSDDESYYRDENSDEMEGSAIHMSMPSDNGEKWKDMSSEQCGKKAGPPRIRKDSITLHHARINKVSSEDCLQASSKQQINSDCDDTGVIDRLSQSGQNADKLSACVGTSDSYSSDNSVDLQHESEHVRVLSDEKRDDSKLYNEEQNMSAISTCSAHGDRPGERIDSLQIYSKSHTLPSTDIQLRSILTCSSSENMHTPPSSCHDSKTINSNETFKVLSSPAPERRDSTESIGNVDSPVFDQNQANEFHTETTVPTSIIDVQKQLSNVFPIPAEEYWSYSPTSSSSSSQSSVNQENLKWSASEESLAASPCSLFPNKTTLNVANNDSHTVDPSGKVLSTDSANHIDKNEHLEHKVKYYPEDVSSVVVTSILDDLSLINEDNPSEADSISVENDRSNTKIAIIKHESIEAGAFKPMTFKEKERSSGFIPNALAVQEMLNSLDCMSSPSEEFTEESTTDERSVAESGTSCIECSSTVASDDKSETDNGVTSYFSDAQEQSERGRQQVFKHSNVSFLCKKYTNSEKQQSDKSSFQSQQNSLNENRIQFPSEIQSQNSNLFPVQKSHPPLCNTDVHSFRSLHRTTNPLPEDLIERFNKAGTRLSPEEHDKSNLVATDSKQSRSSDNIRMKKSFWSNLEMKSNEHVHECKRSPSLSKLQDTYTTKAFNHSRKAWISEANKFVTSSVQMIDRSTMTEELGMKIDSHLSTGDGFGLTNKDQSNKNHSTENISSDMAPLVTVYIGSIILTAACIAVVLKMNMTQSPCECSCQHSASLLDCLYNFIFKKLFL